MLPHRMLGFLMLMFSLCGADSTCPAELNPLTLDPPEIIAEYGERVTINCSSSAEDHDGMYWRADNETYDTEEETNFVSHSVSLSNWDVKAECKIKLDGPRECSKDLNITVYQNPVVFLSIKEPDVAKKWTEYELRCDVINVAPVQNLIVWWHKNNQIIDTKSFPNTTKTPVNESSVLTVRVSREENVVQFRCAAQLDFGPGGPQLPVISQTRNVSSLYAPEFSTMTDFSTMTVYEGNDVTLSCDAEGKPPPFFQWTHNGVKILAKTKDLNITRINANTTYTCRATNYLGTTTKKIYVRVMEIPKTTLTPIPESLAPKGLCSLTLTPSEIVVKFGDPASINCSTTATDVSGMGWEAAVGGTGLQTPPVVTWMVEKLDLWSVNPICYANLQVSTEQCTVIPTITLYQTPDTVLITGPDPGSMLEGREYQLKCDINNVAPLKNLEVKWYRGNETLFTDKFNDTAEKPVNVSSTFRVTPVRDDNGSLFRCGAELHLGPNGPEDLPSVTSKPYTAVVHYHPLIQTCPDHYTVVEHEFRMDRFPCRADGNPPPTVLWYHQDKLVNQSKPLSRTNSGKYTAEFVNSIGRSTTSVNITVQYSPSFTCDERYEIEVNAPLQCEADGLPKPTLTWLKDGEEMVFPERWTKHDSGEYLLKATNTRGTAEHKLYLDILYAPEFKEGNYSKEVTLGKNVAFECSAEGNPPPVVVWNYTPAINLKETTVGRQKIVTVTEATSTNAGVYICVATNKVGSVTRSVTVVMKGKTSNIPLALILGLLILLVVIIFIMLLFCLYKRRRRHGQYNFVPDQATDGSGIPMTTRSAGEGA